MEKVVDTHAWETSRMMITIKSLRTMCFCGNDKKEDEASCGCNTSLDYAELLEDYNERVRELYSRTAVMLQGAALMRTGKKLLSPSIS